MGANDRTATLERQLAAAQQITHIGSWEWDPGTNVVAWSDELYRIYGLEPQSVEMSLELFFSKVHPDDRARIHGEVFHALEQGGSFRYSERIFRPDGSMRYLQTVGEARVDERGKVVGLIGTCRDVTDERTREETIQRFADIVENVDIALSVWSVAGDDGLQSKLRAFNSATERAVGVSLGVRVGQSLATVIPGVERTELGPAISRVAREGTPAELGAFSFEHEPRRIYSLKVFPLPGSCVGVSFDDITVQEAALRLRETEQGVLEAIAGGSPLTDVLARIVRMIEEHAPATLGSVLLLDDSGARVRTGAAPSLPDDYNRAVDGQPIGPKAGSCGTAAFTRQPVFVSDIEIDPLWDDYRAVARAAGLRACWSTPILANDGRVLGTFALYYREPRSPTRPELDLIARATHIAGIAIHRARVDEQLRALTARIEAVREEERSVVAREIHDELGQALTGLKMDIGWLQRHLDDDAACAARLREMSKMTDELIDTVRRISSDLRPGVLDDLGLAAAIEWQAQEFERRTEVTCSVRTNTDDERFVGDFSTAVFRIFQEALTNVARHADASYVDVALEQEGERLRLSVRDDGKGIPPSALSNPSSLGLLGISERARRLGGRVELGGAPGSGTSLVLDVPIPERVQA